MIDGRRDAVRAWVAGAAAPSPRTARPAARAAEAPVAAALGPVVRRRIPAAGGQLVGHRGAVDDRVEQRPGAGAVEQDVRLVGAGRHVARPVCDRQRRALHGVPGQVAEGAGEHAQVAQRRLVVDGEGVRGAR